MIKEFYSKNTLSLYENAINICNEMKGPDNECNICKYLYCSRCRVLCLQEKYNIVNIKTLQAIDINKYTTQNTICMIPDKDCAYSSYEACDYCFLEYLLKDPLIKFIRKEDSYE